MVKNCSKRIKIYFFKELILFYNQKPRCSSQLKICQMKHYLIYLSTWNSRIWVYVSKSQNYLGRLRWIKHFGTLSKLWTKMSLLNFLFKLWLMEQSILASNQLPCHYSQSEGKMWKDAEFTLGEDMDYLEFPIIIWKRWIWTFEETWKFCQPY